MIQNWTRPSGVALIALALSAGMAMAADGATVGQPVAAPTAIDFPSGQKLAVRTLDDPANPYRGQYDAFDRWAWEHNVAGVPAPGVQQPPADAMPQLGVDRVVTAIEHVDSAGWPIPARQVWNDTAVVASKWEPQPGQTVRDFFEGNRAMFEPEWVAPAPAKAVPVVPNFYFTAQGIAPAEVADEWDRLTNQHEARSCPVIPAWLGENPPSQTVPLPDGTFYCYGGLGLRYAGQTGQPGPLYGMTFGDPWYRYGADGKLLTQQPSQVGRHTWTESLLPELTARVYKETTDAQGHPWLMSLRGILFETPPNSLPVDPPGPPSGHTKLLAAYSWDGQPLDLDAPCPRYPAETCVALDPARLSLLYQLQLRLGLTSNTSASPYAGTSQGPVVASGPEPKPLPLLAYGVIDGALVIVRPIGDPANPFRGQYSKWDELLYTHAGESNPERNAAATKQLNDYLTARRAAVKAGQPLPSYPIVGYTEPKNSLWRTLDGVVDADGWLVPQAELLRRNRAAGSGPRPLYFELQAQLQLSADEYQQYMDYYKSIY